MSDDEVVGYGRPPKGSRFKRGQSGNPKGRPKGTRKPSSDHAIDAYNKIILAESNRMISIKEGDRLIKISMFEANVRALNIKGAKGDVRAQLGAIAITRKAREAKSAEWEEAIKTVIEYCEGARTDIA